ncbi:hypothetical protein [Streptomyces shenzhenensis]|uniref:Uncharacterized protein n=1 Tax=Streptomyces shenzhenensis TaxID=943815 RepID=A0A3M0I0B9_9ACTN|nr:hypothetical protein [Streptomyces shenzhenensis]RMB82325.1 hypothetical protein CTZ28_29755 [Streptomyces shenzhenensis]
MVIAVWTVAGVLGAFNRLTGAVETFTSGEQLPKRMPWPQSTGKGRAYMAPWPEIAGAAGVIVPLPLAYTVAGRQWARWVSFTAVVGPARIQVLAPGVHVARREFRALSVNLLLISVGVAAAVLASLPR